MDLIHDTLPTWDITKYTINPDGSLDVHENMDFYKLDFHIPTLPFKLNVVNGNFNADTIGLKSLVNMPHTVNGNFSISSNYISSLEGCPTKINGNFDFADNDVRSLPPNLEVIVSGAINIERNKFPDIFKKPLCDDINSFDDDVDEYDYEAIGLIFKYQRHYEVWSEDGSLNVDNYHTLIQEIKDGLR